MNTVNVRIYKDKKASKPIRNILGINNIPRIKSRGKLELDTKRFNELNFGHIRFHDVALENPGQQVVDIHRIFPLFHLDENNEKNYFFEQTDDYMQSIINSNAEIDFKLGETIDHSLNGRLIQVPDDIDKWARICRNIIGHYKNGEMNGMHLNITRVCVWEEPNNSRLFAGTVEQYTEMFCKVYKLLKKDFPDLKIGGPSTMMSQPVEEFNEKFLMLCKEKGVTPDYFATTLYKRSVDELTEVIWSFKNIMDKCGFYDMKYLLTEWHYSVIDWNTSSGLTENGFDTSESAAFAVSSLIEMTDIDFLDAAYFYSWATGRWALYNSVDPHEELMPVYYGLMYFQKLATECRDRLHLDIDTPSPIKVLAGKTENGKTRILVSAHNCDDCVINLNISDTDEAVLKSIEYEYSVENCISGKKIYSNNGVFTINHTGRHAVYLLETD